MSSHHPSGSAARALDAAARVLAAAGETAAGASADALLAALCREAAGVLDAEAALLFHGSAEDGLELAAVCGLPPELVGHRLEPGAGLAGHAARAGGPLVAGDAPGAVAEPMGGARVAAVAAPLRWGGRQRGVIEVRFSRPEPIGRERLAVLGSFAEMAATACGHASVSAGLVVAARTDGLTGCLNHTALREGIQREIERAERGAAGPPALVMLDLDDFKAVNDRHGHLVGDEVLRRAGHALRRSSRPYDLIARYGGDEFALLAVEADEEHAYEIAIRALDRVQEAVGDLAVEGAGSATAGVAVWAPGVTATELIARADRALLHGKHHEGRGRAHAYSSVPTAGPARRRFARVGGGLPSGSPVQPVAWPAPASPDADRLRKRTRQLLLANALASRLAAMTDVGDILDAAIEELHRAFGYHVCAILRLREDGRIESAAGRGAPYDDRSRRVWTQSAREGLIGRCLRERRPVHADDVLQEPDFLSDEDTPGIRAELVVPLWVGGELWGAIDLEETRVGAFDEDDRMVLQTVADVVGSAMRSAVLYERLDRAYMGTAEALAAALEAKDAYTVDHARSIADRAEAVGRRLGITEPELRDLRFGAIFHDIGKIAVPEAILGKPGPLTDEERAAIERHPVVGEQILAPVDFLAGVRPLVRHEHERWDGAGYPDGLAGEAIPLGSRVILACEALHAMTSDRPYRRALTPGDALGELRRNAGTQFDPRVVDALVSLADPG